MANHKSAKRRVRNSNRKNIFHNQVKGNARSLERRFRLLVTKKDKAQASTTLKTLLIQLDTATQKGCYHKNKSARKKSQMHRLLHTLS